MMGKMRFAVLSCAFVSLLVCAPLTAQRKGKQEKPPEIELIEGSARRQTGNILVDGKIRNCGEKPIKNLVIYFHFFDADRQEITTRKGGVDQDILAPGDEAEFHAQVEEPPRATYYRIDFEDGGGKYLRPAKAPEILAIE
jgi:hypothetical protein